MKKIESIHKGFRNEDEIRKYLFSEHGVHCVSCKMDFTGVEPFDHEVNNANRITLIKEDGKQVTSVPRIVCDCGYKNTVLKLLYQTVKQT